MKFFSSEGQVVAFESDGSQDHLILESMKPLSAPDVDDHLKANGRPAADDIALARIAVWRAGQEGKEITFQHAGRTWDAGLKSQYRIEPLLKLDALPAGFFWTDHDNNDVPVTMEELRAIGAAMNLSIVERGFAIHQRQREMKQKLASMTAEEILAFEPSWSSDETGTGWISPD